VKLATVAGRKAVEVESRRTADGKDVVVHLARGAQRAADRGAQRDGRSGQRGDWSIAREGNLEAVIDSAAFPATAFDQQGVGAAKAQADTLPVGERLRPEDLQAGLVEQPPVRVAGAERDTVEQHLVACAGGELVDPSHAARAEGAADVAVVSDDTARSGQVQQTESVGTKAIEIAVDGQGIGPGGQAQERIAAEFGGVRIHEAAPGDLAAAWPDQAPVEIVIVSKRVDEQLRRRRQRESVGLALTGMVESAVDARIQRQRRAAIDDALQFELVVAGTGVVDAAFQRQNIIARVGRGEHIDVTRESLRPVDQATFRIENAQREIVAGQSQAIDEEALPGKRSEAVKPRLRGRCAARCTTAGTGIAERASDRRV
jgi:hypothetical protein